MDCEGVSPYL
jgi:hypothetical protein